MTHGSLFSGIGGFDLAAEWMGWENVFHCEWNEFGKRVLKYYWPNAESHHDIRETDFTKYRGAIDIVSGGFPCQPYSAAGKRLGKEDERHLWPHMYRAIQEIQPRWVVGENVRGLTNWNGGLVFDEVQSDLEIAGYEITPFLLPAASVNAPHRRDRIWFIAYSIGHGNSSSRKGDKSKIDGSKNTGESKFRGNPTKRIDGSFGLARPTTDTDRDKRSKRRMHKTQSKTTKGHISTRDAFRNQSNTWDKFPTQPPICSGNDGFPGELDGITFSKWIKESIKGYGNAIVPQVVFEIFKAIERYEIETTKGN